MLKQKSVFRNNILMRSDKGEIALVQQLSATEPTLLGIVDNRGNNPLYAAVQSGQERLVDYFVRKNVLLVSMNPITQSVKERMNGKSWKENFPVPLEKLRYVRFVHLGFDDKRHLGELVVSEKAVSDMVEILADLYHAKYPIEKAVLVDNYEGDDERSMDDNNTSAFNCRRMTGGRRWSKHSFGKAVDINPTINHYVKGRIVSPPSGRAYLKRDPTVKGLITKSDAVYNAFTSKGWKWGGDWHIPKDYQHFELP